MCADDSAILADDDLNHDGKMLLPDRRGPFWKKGLHRGGVHARYRLAREVDGFCWRFKFFFIDLRHRLHVLYLYAQEAMTAICNFDLTCDITPLNLLDIV